MRYTIAIFFLAYFPTALSQTWVGTFTVQPGCDINQCCCLSNQIQITQPTTGKLFFNASLTGYCFGQTSYSGQVDNPNGYSITAGNTLVTLGISLSSDSKNLTITNSMGSSCTTTATRQAMGTTAQPSTSTNPNQNGTASNDAAQQRRFDIYTVFSLILFCSILII